MSWIARLRHSLGTRNPKASDLDSLSCSQVSALLMDYVDEALDPETRAGINRHVDGCRCACERALLAELAFTDCVKGTLREGRAPESLKQRILERLSG